MSPSQSRCYIYSEAELSVVRLMGNQPLLHRSVPPLAVLLQNSSSAHEIYGGNNYQGMTTSTRPLELRALQTRYMRQDRYGMDMTSNEMVTILEVASELRSAQMSESGKTKEELDKHHLARPHHLESHTSRCIGSG